MRPRAFGGSPGSNCLPTTPTVPGRRVGVSRATSRSTRPTGAAASSTPSIARTLAGGVAEGGYETERAVGVGGACSSGRRTRGRRSLVSRARTELTGRRHSSAAPSEWLLRLELERRRGGATDVARRVRPGRGPGRRQRIGPVLLGQLERGRGDAGCVRRRRDLLAPQEEDDDPAAEGLAGRVLEDGTERDGLVRAAGRGAGVRHRRRLGGDDDGVRAAPGLVQAVA